MLSDMKGLEGYNVQQVKNKLETDQQNLLRLQLDQSHTEY